MLPLLSSLRFSDHIFPASDQIHRPHSFPNKDLVPRISFLNSIFPNPSPCKHRWMDFPRFAKSFPKRFLKVPNILNAMENSCLSQFHIKPFNNEALVKIMRYPPRHHLPNYQNYLLLEQAQDLVLPKRPANR